MDGVGAFYSFFFLLTGLLKKCYNDVKTMNGDDKMTNKKRVGIMLNASIYDKLQFIAGRYGMTVNSLMAYILGQWADSFDLKERMTDEVMKETKQILAGVVTEEIRKINDSKK